MARGQSISGAKPELTAANADSSLAPRPLAPSAQAPTTLTVNKVTLADLREALIKGFRDFDAVPSHGVFLVVIYPLVGLLLFRIFVLDLPLLPMLYPLATGFALMGPFAAVGLYELSRRRELGLEASPMNILDVLRAPGAATLGLLGLMLLGIFVLWLAAAHFIFLFTFGETQPATLYELVRFSFTTREGWTLVLIGNSVGFLFAMLTFCVSVVSFPLVLERNVGAFDAVRTSLRVVAANPLVMAVWGLVVACALAVGSLFFLVGLIVVLPVLAHASWHLYRHAVGTKE